MLSEMAPSFVLWAPRPETAAYIAPRMLIASLLLSLRRYAALRSGGGLDGNGLVAGLLFVSNHDETAFLTHAFGIGEAIALAGESLNIVLSAGEGAELLADLAHHDVDSLLVDGAAVVAVDVVVDEAAVDDAALAQHQALQQLALAPADLHGLAADRGHAAVEEVGEISDRVRQADMAVDAAGDAAQARCHLRHVHRLRQHVVGAGIDQLDRLGGIAERLQHEHGHADAAVAQRLDEADYVDLAVGNGDDDRFATLGRRFDQVVHLVIDCIAGNAVPNESGLQCFGRHNLFVYQYDSHDEMNPSCYPLLHRPDDLCRRRPVRERCQA